MKKILHKMVALSRGGKCSLLILIATILMSGCGTGLSRSKAKEIIIKHFKYPISTIRRIPIGVIGQYQLNNLDGGDQEEWYDTLRNKGLISYGKWLYISGSLLTEVTMTANGKKYVVAEGVNSSTAYKFADVQMAKEEFVEVTGIKMSGDNRQAVVEYTFKYSSLTPFGEGTKYDDAKPKNATIMLTLYDDGWRVADGSQIQY